MESSDEPLPGFGAFESSPPNFPMDDLTKSLIEDVLYYKYMFEDARPADYEGVEEMWDWWVEGNGYPFKDDATLKHEMILRVRERLWANHCPPRD